MNLTGVVERRRQVADGLGVEARQASAEGENGSERVALVFSAVPNMGTSLSSISCSKALQCTGADGGVRLEVNRPRTGMDILLKPFPAVP